MYKEQAYQLLSAHSLSAVQVCDATMQHAYSVAGFQISFFDYNNLPEYDFAKQEK